MTTDIQLHHRRSIRLEGYDYASEGGYFITVVTHLRKSLFGSVVNDEMNLNKFGTIVKEEWFKTAKLRPSVEMFAQEFVVMPNHIHGIIWIKDHQGRGSLQRTPTVERFQKPVSNSIPTIIRLFKSTITKQINLIRQTPNEPVWQRNYYEHIINSDRDYENIMEYISYNPLAWQTDKEYSG